MADRWDHAITRAHDRYGVELTRSDLGNIAYMIRENRGTFIEQNEDKKTLWWVTYKDTRLRVVISTDFYDVVTFLPPFEKSERAKQRNARARKKRAARRKRSVYKHGEVYYEPTDGVEI